ncbi:MAG: peptidoglycan-binding protein [Defluviitaleaceae bacterium]|nr:peptidoglycan-binding protein [Defluviitaleaceae bacterium]
MGKGFLQIQTVTVLGSLPVPNVEITITDEQDVVLYNFKTDEFGFSPVAELETKDESLTEDPNFPGLRYRTYKSRVEKEGYVPVWIDGIMILDTSTSILRVEMTLVVPGNEGYIKHLHIGGHKLDNPVTSEQQVEPQQVINETEGTQESGIAPFILPEVIIPNFIRVKLGRETNAAAPVVSVPYIEYIKNVTSHEIFDTWPEQTIIANVHCIVSFTLNRIYTEFYRKRGRNFDITSETYMDQKYVHGGVIGARISAVVDRIFSNYLAIVGHKEPFLSLYNDGIRVNIPGRLSQWGSFYDAFDRGMTSWQIINKYFSQSLELREVESFGGVLESYPGYTLTMGTRGDVVRTMQLFLNRILGRYTDVIINPVDGVFGQQTRNSVLMFQRIYNLPQTGNIDRRTWYEISRIYAIERALWEMYSEGQRIGIGRTPPTRTVRRNDTGASVVEIQFLLDFISMYHSEIPFVPQTSRFDALTENAVREFQRLFNITADGIVGATTWSKLYDVYWGIVDSGVGGGGGGGGGGCGIENPPFPGVSLRVGSAGNSVRLIQQAINKLAEFIPGLWQIAEDGIFGNGTREAVIAFQRIFGLVVDGIVGPNTWRRLMEEACIPVGGGGGTEFPPFPGTNLGVGSSGTNVRLIQEAINRLAPCHPGRLWILSADGQFGNITRDAIFTFQSIFGLPITGIVGQVTWDRLMREAANCSSGGGGGGGTIPPFPGANIGVGSSGANVRLIQEAINRLVPCQERLWTLTVDGQFGNITRDAIFTFQNIFGLQITGIVGQITWDRLMREAANCGSGAQSISELPVTGVANQYISTENSEQGIQMINSLMMANLLFNAGKNSYRRG